MSPTAPRFLSAADETRAAELLRRQNDKRAAWPYDHLEPPPYAVPVNEPGFVAIPAQGVTATVLPYRVPAYFRLVLQGILQDVSIASNPGDTLWTVKVNPNGGVQANPVQGLVNWPVNLGSYRYGTPWWFAQPYFFDANDLLTSLATNVNLNPGTGNNYISAFLGYLLPE